MLAFIARRLLTMIPLLIIVSMITFFIIQLPPGDFFDTMEAEIAANGGAQDSRTFEVLRERYGLDQPLYVQYLRWVQGWPEGDFGWSLAWNSPVWPLVRDRLLYTVILGAFSLLITVSYAIPVGIYSATRQYSVGDNFFSLIGFLGLSLPGFCLLSFGCSWARWCCASMLAASCPQSSQASHLAGQSSSICGTISGQPR